MIIPEQQGRENARDPEITAFLRYVDGKADDAEHDGHVHAGLQRIRVDDGIGVVIIDIMIMGLVSRITAAAGTILCRRYQMPFSCAAITCQEIMGNPQLLFLSLIHI
mgnify:FL=1